MTNIEKEKKQLILKIQRLQLRLKYLEDIEKLEVEATESKSFSNKKTP